MTTTEQASSKPEATLRSIPLLRGAAEAELRALAPLARWRNAAPGELLVDFGEPSLDVYFVLQGSVRVLLRSTDGKELVFGDLGPGECFGELAAIDGEPRSTNVTARTAARLCILPGDVFLGWVLGSREGCLALLRMMTRRLRENGERLHEFATRSVRQRLIATLLRLARPRAGGAAGLVVSPPPTHEEMSARIGARREMVSREMAALARSGLLAVNRGAIMLPQPELLRAAFEAPGRGEKLARRTK